MKQNRRRPLRENTSHFVKAPKLNERFIKRFRKHYKAFCRRHGVPYDEWRGGKSD